MTRAPSRRGGEGFTLLEALLVVAVIGILASIAAPSLTRARSTALEAEAIWSLRTMNTALASFAATCGGGSFPPSVVWLTKPPIGEGAWSGAFIGPDFAASPVDRQGYRIRFIAGPRQSNSPLSCNGLAAGRGVQSYFIAADPLPANTSLRMRFFGTSSVGTIFQSPVRVRAFYGGSAAAPATLIQ